MRNEKGSIIILALFILTLLSLIGAHAARTVQIDLLISKNAMTAKQAFYAAESGIQMGIAKLNGGCLDTPPCSVDDYTEYADGYSYKFDVLETDQLYEGNPTYVIDAYGNKHDGHAHVTAGVFQERQPDLKAPVALYVLGNLVNNGVSGSVWGEYSEPLCVVDDIWTTETSMDTMEATNYTGDLGPSIKTNNDMPYYPFMDVFSYLRKYHDVQILNPTNNMNLGDALNMTQIFYIDGDTSISNLDGYGILLVDGDFVSSGNVSWHGLVLINGNVTYNGGGTKEIYGSVLVKGDATLNGTVDIRYDYCGLGDDLKDKLKRFKKVWWENARD